MERPFSVGEIAIMQNAELFPDLNGKECLVMKVGVPASSAITGTAYSAYLIKTQDGVECFAAHFQLRRRKPPQADSNERMYVQMWRDMAGKAPQRVGEPA